MSKEREHLPTWLVAAMAERAKKIQEENKGMTNTEAILRTFKEMEDSGWKLED